MSPQLALPEDEHETRLRSELINRFEVCSVAENILGDPTTLVFLEEQVRGQKVIYQAQADYRRALDEWRAYRKTQRDAKELQSNVVP